MKNIPDMLFVIDTNKEAIAIKEAKKMSKNTIVVVNSCGDAYKDKKILRDRLGKKYA